MAKTQVDCMTFDADGERFDFCMSHRDFAILGGPPLFIPFGTDLIDALGVYENTRVAQGMKIPDDSSVIRRRSTLFSAAQSVLPTLKRDFDLLSRDYSFRLTKGEDRHKLKMTLSGFRVRELYGYVNGCPAGFCTLTLCTPSPIGIARTAELIDLRLLEAVATDDKGDLRIYRADAKFGLRDALEKLLEFLTNSRAETITIYHNGG